MKILIVSQKYFPEPFSINSIAEKLVLKGHQVSVLCGIPNYPEGNYYKGYSTCGPKMEILNGVTVIRTFEFPRKKGILCRFLNYYSFAFSGKKYARKLDKDFDVVLVNGLSPIMMSLPAIEYKRRNKAKILMYEMDLWPESLLAGGVKKGSLIYRHYQKISAKIYGSMDEILVSSKAHIDYILNLIRPKKQPIEWCPQYSNDNITSISRKYIDKQNYICIFTGNIGKAQSLKTLLDAAKILENGSIDISFIIAGNGSERELLESYMKDKKIGNVLFVNRRAGKEFDDLLKKADLGVVMLKKDSYCEMTLPRKVQTYMKAGLPIISCAGRATNEIVEQAQCGLCSAPENPESLSKSIETFLGLPEKEKEKMSDNAISFYRQHLTEERFISILENRLKKLSIKKSVQ